MAITLEGRPNGTYPFGVFHTSLGSTLRTESDLENVLSVGRVPSSAVSDTQTYELLDNVIRVLDDILLQHRSN